jgi:hypothetical protein
MSVTIPIVAADGSKSTVTLAAPVIITGFPYTLPFPLAAAVDFPYTLPFPFEET